MGYPSRYRSHKNRHAWTYLGGQPEGVAGWRYECPRCGEEWSDDGYWSPMLPPLPGCVALPMPAVSAPNSDNLPRASYGT